MHICFEFIRNRIQRTVADDMPVAITPLAACLAEHLHPLLPGIVIQKCLINSDDNINPQLFAEPLIDRGDILTQFEITDQFAIDPPWIHPPQRQRSQRSQFETRGRLPGFSSGLESMAVNDIVESVGLVDPQKTGLVRTMEVNMCNRFGQTDLVKNRRRRRQ